MTDETTPELLRFIRGECDPADFPHREHVRMGFEMLRRHDFTEASLHYCRALQAMSKRAGRPQAFHLTITLAFLSLIAEGTVAGEAESFERFACRNVRLFDKGLLRRHYSPERLASDTARQTFLLPDLAP
jgi:hypothetical protein